MLIELDAYHFWIFSSDTRREKPPVEEVRKFHKLSWRIADELRKVDELKDVEDILQMLFSIDFDTERARSKKLHEIIDRLGRRVNPRYQNKINQISQENQNLMERDFDEYWRRLRNIQTP